VPTEVRQFSGLEIAVIGLACRFPEAATPEAFWRNLLEARESIRRFSKSELENRGRHPDTLSDSRFIPAHGAIEGFEEFDPGFFSYSLREASLIDPQQRLFLQTCWEALERGGYADPAVRRPVGVFAGASPNTYFQANLLPHLSSDAAAVFQAGYSNNNDFLATRVSYKLNLSGPSATVQTGCSTSLVAIQMACQSLLAGACELALAGGVSLTLPQQWGYFYEDGMILSADGHCRVFDAQATGTVKGDGCGVVLLKRLSDAIRDDDPIDCIILAAATNNDGADKVGFTAPSVSGQVAVLREALALADVPPESIGLIEAHGTGTKLGDPIEIAAITQAYGVAGSNTKHTVIGSVKSNIGHLDAAAGIAGFIKATLAVKNNQIPPTLHFTTPNPNIDFDNSPVAVASERMPWPDSGGPRRAAISSFGIGGTNAHVIIEEFQKAPTRRDAQNRDWPIVLPLSARSSVALSKQRLRIAEALDANPELALEDVAFTQSTARARFEHAGFAVGNTREQIVAALKGKPGGLWCEVTASRHQTPSVVFLFPGQGAQYVGMARALYERDKVFAQHFDRCAKRFATRHALDIRAAVFANPSAEAEKQLQETQIAQCAIFAIEVSLATAWRALGVVPAAVLGHSIGEFAAAYTAGVFTFEDAADLVALRGRFMQEMPRGSMAAVNLSPDAVVAYLQSGLSLAAINGPSRCVISGPTDELQQALAAIERDRGVGGTLLQTSHAFHSTMMEPAAERFAAAVEEVPRRGATIPFISTVTGGLIEPSNLASAEYWRRNLRDTVRFADAASVALEMANPVLLEVGPGSTLTSLCKALPQSQHGVLTAVSLRHPKDEADDILVFARAAATLQLAGAPITVRSTQTGQRVVLPVYPFETVRCWIDPPSGEPKQRAPLAIKQPVLYAPSWVRASAPILPETKRGSRWLITGAPGPLRSALARQARLAAMDVGELDFAQAAAQIGDRAGPECEHLLIVAGSSTPDAPRPEWFNAFVAFAGAVAQESKPPRHITLVTWSAFDVLGNECPDAWAAAAASFARVMGQEIPGCDVNVIDVSTAVATIETSATQIVQNVLADWPEPVTAYRNGRRWLPSTARLTPIAAPLLPIPKGSVWLITGGTGGMGIELASFLIRELDARVALLGRTPVPPRERWAERIAGSAEGDKTASLLKRLSAIDPGPSWLMLIEADVTDPAAVSEALRCVRETWGTIDVIIHGAGRVGSAADLPISNMRPQDVGLHLGAKIDGILNIAQAIRTEPPKLVVLSSSLAAQLGGLGAGLYSAANAYLDAFAISRRDDAARWVSLNWDSWRFYQDAAVPPNLPMLERDAALQAFVQAIAVGESEVLVSATDWESRIARPAPRVEAQAARTAQASGPVASPYEPALTEPERLLRDIWRELFHAEISTKDNFFALGGDSVIAMQMVARGKTQGLHITPNQVFQHQTIAELAAAIAPATRPKAALAAPQKAAMLEARSAPLSFAQERVWFLEQLTPGTTVFVLQTTMKIDGPLDMEALRKALALIVDRHDVLRSSIRRENGEPAQTILPLLPFELETHDLSQVRNSEQEPLARTIMDTNAGPFELEKPPLMRASLVRLGDQRHWLGLALHHIAVDDISFAVLFGELSQAYASFQRGVAPSISPVEQSYGDFAAKQRALLAGEAGQALRRYWAEKLSGDLRPLELPTDRPRPAVQSMSGAVETFTIAADAAQALRKLAGTNGASLYMALVAVLNALLAKYSGSDDVLIGTPFANRPPEAKQSVGLFVNTVVLRTALKPDMDFLALLKQVRQTVLDAMAHQDLPFDQLVRALQLPRDLSRSPVFQVMLSFLNAASPDIKLGGADVTLEPRRGSGSEYDLSVYLRDNAPGGPLAGWIEYNPDLFDATTMARFCKHMQTLIQSATSAPEKPIDQLPIMDEHEREQLISGWNPTSTPLGYAGSIATLFEAQVKRGPGRIAVQFNGQTLSYAELDRRANRLANALLAKGSVPNRPVAVILSRSLDLIVALLAISKAGAPYLPVDPDFPAHRIAHMVGDSGANLVVTESAYLHLAGDGMQIIIGDDAVWLNSLPDTSPNRSAAADDIAYLIYTSGSTGTPKGVAVTNRNVFNFLTGAAKAPGCGPADVLVAVTTVSFDIHVLELFLPLTVGGTVVIARREVALDGRLLLKLLNDVGATIFQGTPAAWQLLLDAGLGEGGTLKALCGGEAWPAGLAEQLLPRVSELWNMYGPTEATVWSSATHITNSSEPVTVGFPMQNTEFHVVGTDLQLLPAGLIGELLIGGAGIAAGYHNRPDLTAERFMRTPFQGASGRYYRTGDRARRLADGRIQLLGRLDNQVKLRGYRIELGDVEAAFQGLDAVRECTAVIRDDLPGGRQLVAYLVAEGTFRPSPKSLSDELRKVLPQYMIPSRFVWLNAMPRTPNGKIDRRALPVPDSAAVATAASTSAMSPREQMIAGIFQTVLGVPHVRRSDNFFDLGGHSLLSLRVVDQIEKATGMRMSPGELFSQTVAQLAQAWPDQQEKPSSAVPPRATPKKRRLADLFSRPGGL
jgi:amino acid adenylation domain-containing protein